MTHNLRTALGLIIGMLAALLLAGTASSFIIGARLQRDLAGLQLEQRSALEQELLHSLAARLAAPAPPLDEAAAVAATLRRQDGAAPALAADLDALAAAARATGAGPGPSSQAALADARSRFDASLAAYAAAQAADARLVAAAFASQSSGVIFSAAAVLLVCLTLLGLLLLVNTALLRPLRQLGDALTAVGRGDLSVSLPARLPQEFSPLVEGYNLMTEALRQRQQALDDQLRRTGLLTQLSIELRDGLDPKHIAEHVLRAVAGNRGLDEATMILTSPSGAVEESYRWCEGMVQRLGPELVAPLIAHGMEGYVQGLGSPVVIADVGSNERWRTGGGHLHGSAIVLPLQQAGAELGLLTVYSRQPGSFTNRDLLLMEGVVAQAAVALGTARRFQDERHQARLALTLLGMSQLLTGEGRHSEIAALLDEQSRAVFAAEQGLLWLADPEGTLRLVPPPQRPELTPSTLSHAEAVAAAACASGQIITEGRGATQDELFYLALPLTHGGERKGACVLLQHRRGDVVFSPNLWSLLAVFTNIIASACATIDLVEQLRSYTGRLESLVEGHTHELRRSRDLLRVVFDNLPEGLLLMTGDGTLLAANNAFGRAIVGRIPRDVVGRSYRQLWEELAQNTELQLTPQGPAEDDTPLIPPVGAQLSGKPATWRVLSTDLVGQQRWYAVERTPVLGLQGEEDQFLERWRDITHHEVLQRRLLLTEQMTSLGRLAASVAHEVGNPLQSAMGCLELCREDRQLSAGAREYLDLALGELSRMSRTMDSLRNLYRPPQINWESVQLNQIVRQVAQFTRGQLEKARVRLELELDEELPPISGQPDALRQVLLNLTLNAQEAMPRGGTIKVSTHRKPTDRLCRIVVQDTGVGIGREQLDYLFEPFRSGKAQGVGLGLYLSKQIVEQHGGQITITSQPGQGTIVTMLLPWSEARPHGGYEPALIEVEGEAS